MIFVVQLGVGITSYILSSDVENFLEDNMFKSMRNYNTSRAGVYRTWNVVQHEHACCGTKNYEDWKSTYYGESVNGVPDACCKEFTTDCGRNVFQDDTKLEQINQGGCFDKLKGDIKDNITVLGGVAIGIGCVQVLGPRPLSRNVFRFICASLSLSASILPLLFFSSSPLVLLFFFLVLADRTVTL
ncbi:CD151 antigen-like [Penaeus japonicus]|uniref:CD151 antigen-like n=1 Tax=Penaeus japonicus TaxID=27405 RepID=UPI001C715451|nr:CD151 antigen-like [Penaeus japonicus]